MRSTRFKLKSPDVSSGGEWCGACTVESSCRWMGGRLYCKVPCPEEGPVQWGSMSIARVGNHIWWAPYNEVQWIMGNCHVGPPIWTDKQDWKHYLPATSVAGGNNTMFNTENIQLKAITIRSHVWNERLPCNIFIYNYTKGGFERLNTNQYKYNGQLILNNLMTCEVCFCWHWYEKQVNSAKGLFKSSETTLEKKQNNQGHR